MGDKQDRLTDHFKLRFYVSFQSRKDSIGLELLEALHEFCNQTGRDNFELHLRISNENKPRRWDAAFINEQLAGESEKSLKKVWVCGPPVMAETFDLAFSGMKAQNPNRFGTGVLEVL
jgi:predicted ferric reductase